MNPFIPMAKSSLKDVAAEAGVSLAAATYALRPGPRPTFVSEETQARVRAVAERMGFRVNALARSLRSKRRYSIAILCGQLRDRAAISAAESIIAYLSDTPYAGVVATCAQVRDIRGYVLRHLDSQSHDAVIFIRDDQLITPQLLKSLFRAGIRVGAIMPAREDLPYVPLAYLDRPKAAAMLIEELAARGHRQIDYVLPAAVHASLSEQILNVAAQWRARVRFVPLEIESNDVNEFRVGVDTARHTLADSAATAVAVFYENLALGVVQGLGLAGITVPARKSVLAYGSTAAFESNEPPVSAVCHPIEDVGRTIARNVIQWIEADFSRTSVVQSPFTPEYLPRATVADGPARK